MALFILVVLFDGVAMLSRYLSDFQEFVVVIEYVIFEADKSTVIVKSFKEHLGFLDSLTLCD